MRDGALLKADIFRPDSSEQFPVLMAMSAYQKDKLWIPPPDMDEKPNQYMVWETPNPEWWVPRGYILIRVDSRGSGKSRGFAEPWRRQEAVDYYDSIEWAGVQRWSSGNVGLLGISYMAMDQWWVAMLQPPHLKAIIPWEGAADLYRDTLYHGGILCDFDINWWTNGVIATLHGPARAYNPDAMSLNWNWEVLRNWLDTGFYKGVQADWDKIVVPMYSVGNWNQSGLHLRGNTEGFMRAASQNKKLRIDTGSHGTPGTHFHPFYSESGRMDQIRFFDQWLKGIDTGIMKEPRVKVCATTGNDECEWRYNNDWPFDNTQWTKFYLSAPSAGEAKDAPGALVKTAPGSRGEVTYLAQNRWRDAPRPPKEITFETQPLTEDTQVIGPINLVMWVSSSTDDMNIFASVRNIDPDGKEVTYSPRSINAERPPAAKGWLRVSQRKLDTKLSLPYRPYHTHDEEQKLKPGEVVKVEVEIWPAGMVFKKGARIRLDVQPTDGKGADNARHTLTEAESLTPVTNSVYTGGDHASYLLLPIIPTKQDGTISSRVTNP
jgi:predicted acyl esterase